MYNYSLLSGSSLSNRYENYSAIITGVSDNDDSFNKFRPGSRAIKIIGLLNRDSLNSDNPYTYFKNIVFEETD